MLLIEYDCEIQSYVDSTIESPSSEGILLWGHPYKYPLGLPIPLVHPSRYAQMHNLSLYKVIIFISLYINTDIGIGGFARRETPLGGS